MKRTTKIAVAIGLALGVGLGATTLSAHPTGGNWGMGGPGWGAGHMMGYGPGAGSGMGPGRGYGHMMGYGPGAAESAEAFVETRLAGLKAELKIDAAQESAWNAYVEATKLQADSMRKWMTTMHDSQAASVPERIELRNQVRKQRQVQSEATGQKLKDLYATLNPEQKALADQYLGGFGSRAGFGPGRRIR